MTNRIDNNDIVSILEKQLKPYATKYLLRETTHGNELKFTKEMATNMAKYNDLLINSERSIITMIDNKISSALGKFLNALGLGGLAICGGAAYLKNELNQKIDKLDQKIDRILERSAK